MKFIVSTLIIFLSLSTISNSANWETTEKYGIPILQNKNNKDLFVQIFINGPDYKFLKEEPLPGGLIKLIYISGSAGTKSIITETRGIIYHPEEEMFLGNFPISFTAGEEPIGRQPVWTVKEDEIHIQNWVDAEEWTVKIPKN